MGGQQQQVVQLDPRELYRAKKSMQIVKNSLDFQQTPYFMPNKPTMFGGHRSNRMQNLKQRNEDRQQLTQVKMTPLKGSPQKLLITQIYNSQVTPHTSSPGPRKMTLMNGGTNHTRMNQTLMHLRNRTQPPMTSNNASELPSLDQNNQSTHPSYGVKVKESLDNYDLRKSRAVTNDQKRSLDASSNQYQRMKAGGDLTTPRLEKLARKPFTVEHGVASAISPTDTTHSVGGVAKALAHIPMNFNNNKMIMNNTQNANFYSTSIEQHSRRIHGGMQVVMPQTAVQQQRNFNLFQQAKTTAPNSTFRGDLQMQEQRISIQKTNENVEFENNKSLQTRRSVNYPPNSQKEGQDTELNTPISKLQPSNPPSFPIQVGPLGPNSPGKRQSSFSYEIPEQKVNNSKLRVQSSKAGDECTSAVFMMKASEVGVGSERYEFENLSDVGNKRPSAIKTDNTPQKGIEKSPITEHEKVPIEVTRVPAVIATKSGKVMTGLQRRHSSKMPLQNSNSYISSTHIEKSRKQVKKLASQNNDLTDVVTMRELDRNKSNKSSKRALSRPKTTLQVDFLDSGAQNIKRVTEEDNCLVMSKETLISPSKCKSKDNINESQSRTQLMNVTSSQTFRKEKIQQIRPPRLEINQIDRVLDGPIKTSPRTPTLNNNIRNTELAYQEQVQAIDFKNLLDLSPNTAVRKQVAKGMTCATFGSNLTLTMSQLNKEEIHTFQKFNDSKNLAAKDVQQKSQSPCKLVYVSDRENDDQQDISPLIIQTNSLAKRAIHLKQENKLRQQQYMKEQKITQEEKTLQKISKLEENNSMIIDCNVLQGERQSRLKTIQTQPGINFETQTDGMFNNSALARFSQKEVTNSVRDSMKKQSSTVENPKKFLLGNPLQTSQILSPRRKPTTQTVRQSIETKPRDYSLEKNEKKQEFGVGSVVLHLRKQRVISNLNKLEENFENLKSGGHDIETISDGTRELTSRVQTGASGERIGVYSQGISTPREVLPKYQIRSKLDGKGKNGHVLIQKPFTNIVRVNNKAPQTQQKPVTQRPAQINHQTKQQKPVSQRKKKGSKISNGKLGRLELVGTQKEQVIQQPRLPKYDVQRARRSPRGSSYQPPQSNFFIPHYNYFGGAPTQNIQYVQQDTFGETLHPAQMHQLITLQNGQMMIRRVDVTLTPNDQISINFDHQNAIGTEPQTAEFPLNRSSDPGQVTDFGISSFSRQGQTPESQTQTFQAAETPLETPQTAELPSRTKMMQYLDLPQITANSNIDNNNNNLIQLKHNRRKRNSSIAVETVLGTEESYASNLCKQEIIEEEQNESKLPLTMIKQLKSNPNVVEPQSARLSKFKRQKSPDSERHELYANQGSNSQNDHYKGEQIQRNLQRHRHVTQRIAHLVDQNMSGEIRLRENPDEALLVAPEYVYSQKIQLTGNIIRENGHNSMNNDQIQIKQHQSLAPSDGIQGTNVTDDQISYNYLLSQGLHLQTTDERISENHESALELRYPVNSAENYNDNQPPITPPKVKDYQMQGNNNRKLVIINRSPDKVQRQTNRFQTQLSQQSNDWNETTLKATLNDAKLEQEPTQLSKQLVNQSNSKKKPVYEDPIIMAKKQSPRLPFRTMRDLTKESRINEFKPWDDKPDACLSISPNGGKRNLIKVSSSLDAKAMSPKSSYDKMQQARLQASFNQHNSSLQSIKESHSSRTRISKNSPTPNLNSSLNHQPPRLSSQHVTNPIQQTRLRVSSKAMIVNDQAKSSVRAKQEREMNAIVFDDLNTPHFKYRKDATDDDTKALEEIAKKPLTINLDGITSFATHANKAVAESTDLNIGDLSTQQHMPSDQLTDAEKNAQLRMPVANKMGSRSSKNRRKSSAQKGNRSSTNRQHQQQIDPKQDAVLTTHEDEMHCLRTSDLKFNQPKPEIEESDARIVRIVADDQEFEETQYVEGQTRRNGWKAPVPDSVECTHINNAHLDSYF